MNLSRDPAVGGADPATTVWWKPSEMHADHRIVDAAFRHGVACSRGIAMDAWIVVALKRPNQLAGMLAALDVRLEAARPQADLVDRRLGEGAAADRSRIDTAVRDSVIDGLDEADDEITPPATSTDAR